ncbi:MAG TPA: manganese efflux pump MntP family protein [Spirochaetota bacterium]|nr:manganese efflux pump MntP family protein [Spirochaetota bacterium]HNT13020.1 manganese efflux pump MntP family protein [Spirochaetota bacterium]HNV48724.1 manganese efflux pump MntP family protein [Spirochaetota bacterium]HOS41169.1 manganese efflux pump MntP family protein [Spirochaetota bacterium]HPU88888.1 manganese efflux pump MntP family protein [Spirochaetota bacterium]
MNLADSLAILGIAVGLAMDAFSVCIAAGMIIDRPTARHYFRLAFHFGLFQFMMPILGYFAGRYLESIIKDYDHWIALAILTVIGAKMIRESLSDDDRRIERDPSRGWTLIVLAVATSIDALAVGLSLGLLGSGILVPSVIIGVVCALFSVIGISIGKRVGALFGRRVEMIGGVILIAIGIRIAVSHLFP